MSGIRSDSYSENRGVNSEREEGENVVELMEGFISVYGLKRVDNELIAGWRYYGGEGLFVSIF